MKRRIVLTLLALVVMLSLTIVKPIADQPIVDSQKSRQELETMEGILSTTLGYAVKRLSANQAGEGERVWRGLKMERHEVSGYYVYGQGAVFMVPVSALQRHQDMDFAFAFGDVAEMVDPAAVTAEVEAALADLEESDDADKVMEKAEKVQQEAEARKKELTQKMAKQKEKLQQFQEQAKKRKAEMEEKRKELINRLGQIKVDLKDALARYGDSLSIVKPEESVTIILSDDRNFHWGDGESSGSICHVLTVKKSLVTDFKAGKITREDFDRRLIDYSY